jgi:uncharacterized protein (TIGR02996 family)
MPDAESFVAAIAANPADDLPRLVFADWLDENGDPARAGFIRDHVQLAKLRPGTDAYKTLFRKCADTLKANLPAWIKPACDAFGQPAEWKPGKAVGGRFAIQIHNPTGHPLYHLEFARGLIDQATLRLPHVRDEKPLDELFRNHPITRLTTTFLSMPAGQWEAVVTPRMRSVRQLTFSAGGNPEAAAEVFASPHLERVTQFTFTVASVAEQLVRSPMAKRILALDAPGERDVIEVLREFPLDDKLQQFTVLGGPAPTNAKIKIGTMTHLGGYISRVAFRPTLKRLDLTRCGMTDDGLAAFARGEEWLRLQGLKLAGNLFGDRGWADFCRGWRTPELSYLDASRNRLTDAGAEMLSRSGMLKTLRVIDLRGNRIAGRGAVALARAVAEGKVNRLLLAGNPVGKREAATVKGLLGERVDLANGAT